MTKSAKMGRKRERTISAFSDDGISQVRKHITNIEYNQKSIHSKSYPLQWIQRHCTAVLCSYRNM